MKDVLEPLSHVAGVRQAAIISGDGVPVLVLERAVRGGEFVERAHGAAPKLSGQRIDPTSFGALAVQFVCPNWHAGHLILTHYAPVVVFGAGALLIGRRWLDWAPRV